jgi:hypothetical protein
MVQPVKDRLHKSAARNRNFAPFAQMSKIDIKASYEDFKNEVEQVRDYVCQNVSGKEEEELHKRTKIPTITAEAGASCKRACRIHYQAKKKKRLPPLAAADSE